MAPGPRSSRFHVIDYDATTGTLGPEAVLTSLDDRGEADFVDVFRDRSDAELLNDPAFHAQHIYAVAAKTLARFEFALGRRLSWGFGDHQLTLVPHAFAEANAYYSDSARGVLLGYFPNDASQELLTCLSHDVVAHETTHAILDGLRHRFLEPGLPDQAAFHEALADIVALLSIFALDSVVQTLLGEADSRGRIPATNVDIDRLRENALLGVAEQVGAVLRQGRGPLRQSAKLQPGTAWQSDPAFNEPHLRGEVLVAIVLEVLLKMWTGRLPAIVRDDNMLDRARAAEEGAKAADHLLTMVIRAIDYLPPVEFEYVDFLDAILTSDGEVSPDDSHDYRGALTVAFENFGITRSVGGEIIDLSAGGIAPLYKGLNFAALRTDVDEVFRFIWENASALDIDLSHYTVVESVRPSVRIGPDGMVVNEAVADYVQMLELRGSEFVQMAQRWAAQAGNADVTIALPPAVEPDTKLDLLGGGTLIFDQFGRAKYHITKPLNDWSRQLKRLEFLARAGQYDSEGRLGFSSGSLPGQRFAELHQPSSRAGEAW